MMCAIVPNGWPACTTHREGVAQDVRCDVIAQAGINGLAFFRAPVSVAVWSLPFGGTPTIGGSKIVSRLTTGCPALCMGAIGADQPAAFRERRFRIAITPGSRIVARTMAKLSQSIDFLPATSTASPAPWTTACVVCSALLRLASIVVATSFPTHPPSVDTVSAPLPSFQLYRQADLDRLMHTVHFEQLSNSQ